MFDQYHSCKYTIDQESISLINLTAHVLTGQRMISYFASGTEPQKNNNGRLARVGSAESLYSNNPLYDRVALNRAPLYARM